MRTLQEIQENAGLTALDFALLAVPNYQDLKARFTTENQTLFSAHLREDPGFLPKLKECLSSEGLSFPTGEFSVQAVFDSFFEAIESTLNQQDNIFTGLHDLLKVETDLDRAEELLLELNAIVERRSKVLGRLEIGLLSCVAEAAVQVRPVLPANTNYSTTQGPCLFGVKAAGLGVDFTPGTPKKGPSLGGNQF